MDRQTETDEPATTVSVVTPAFNAANYLAQTLESALAQTFTDFELLIVDDGSTDDTAAIAQAYAERDPRVRVIRQPHRGIAAARNVAIAQARGRFLALLDSDDLWCPEYLAEQVGILQRHPDLAVLSANAINLGGAFDGQPLFACSAQSHLRKVSLLTLVRDEQTISIFTLFRREVVDLIGGFDETFRRCEDYDFWLRAAAAGCRIAVYPKPLGLYRRRPDSMSAREVLMLHAARTVLSKLRQRCGDRPEVQASVDWQLARLAKRVMLATARELLVEGDMAHLAQQFGALAEATGMRRYRVAEWLSNRAPATIWWAYRCKLRFRHLARSRRNHANSVWLSRGVAQ